MRPDTIVMIFVLAWCAFSTVGGWWIARHLVRLNWNDPLAPYPLREPAHEDQPAETRRFQSFGAGLLNLGWSIHTTVDQRFVHMTPTRLARWLGVKGASAPWDEISIGPPGMTPTLTPARMLRINGKAITAPKWVAERAPVRQGEAQHAS